MVKTLKVDQPFEFLGRKYENLDQLRANLTELPSNYHHAYKLYKDELGYLVLVRFELYPCFDSYDRMYEDRYYRYLFYCKNEEEVQVKLDYLNNQTVIGSCAQNEAVLVPNIFYGEDLLNFEMAI